jgi:hypothetical protein
MIVASRSAICGIPSASIAHIAHTAGPSASCTRCVLGTPGANVAPIFTFPKGGKVSIEESDKAVTVVIVDDSGEPVARRYRSEKSVSGMKRP